MKTIGFVGAYDKTDMLLNIAKVLTTLGKTVLLIDSTITQKARYVVPAINPTVTYITFFEDIDVGVGFRSIEDVKRYLGITTDLPYDYVLVDVDSDELVTGFALESATKNYFVTSFDVYSLKRGIEILNGLTVPVSMTKILFTKEALKEEDDYLNYLSRGSKIVWDDERIYFPLENGDLSTLYENQRLQNIKFKKLSVEYRDNIAYISQQILEQNNDLEVMRAMKIIERGA